MKTFRKKFIVGIIFMCSILTACENNKKTNNTSVNKDYLDESENDVESSTKLNKENAKKSDKVKDSKEKADDKITLKYVATAPEDYIDKCIFLGDSRTVGFGMTSYPRKGSWLADIGITHIGAMNMKYKTKEGTVYTLDSYLDSHQASIVYVCYGVNGINTTGEDQYKLQYDKLIDKIKEKEPRSKIVIVSILPVRDEGSYKNVLVSEDVRKYNEFLYDLAEKKGVLYLDLYEQIADKDGQMNEKYDAGDGLHFASKTYDDIYDYIIHHPVSDYETEGLNQYPKENMIWHTPVKKTPAPETTGDTTTSENDENNIFDNPTDYDFSNMDDQSWEENGDSNSEVVNPDANDGENAENPEENIDGKTTENQDEYMDGNTTDNEDNTTENEENTTENNTPTSNDGDKVDGGENAPTENAPTENAPAENEAGDGGTEQSVSECGC